MVLQTWYHMCCTVLNTTMQGKNPMFQHSKGHCDVTRYAADYVALKGEHLFSSKSGSGGSAGKKTKS